MKVIELLAKIANGEEVPLVINIKGYKYRKVNGQFWCDETERYMIEDCTSINNLNDEVEIIEEDKKIEHIGIPVIDGDNTCNELMKSINVITEDISNKINEIIDYINKGE